MLYAQGQYAEYMLGNTSVDVSGDGTEEEKYYTDLKKYAPPFILNMEEFDTEYEIAGEEVGRAAHYAEDLEKQYYISTATWGIKKWEKIYGIAGSEGSTLEQRRAAVRMRLIGGRTFTPALVEKIAQDVTGTEAQVQEDTENYTFTVFFIGTYGVPNGIREFREWLKMAKPAHLAVVIKYRYVTWKEIEGRKWKDLKSYTWDSIRVQQETKKVTWARMANTGMTWKNLNDKETWKEVKNMEEAKE